MTRAEGPTKKLRSSNPTERLEAARFFAENAEKSHEDLLRKALAGETVLWIRTALNRALARIAPTHADDSPPGIATEDLPAEFVAQIQAEALETTAKQILHEIEPLLGMLRLAAEREVQSFEQSDTRVQLDRFDDLVSTLARLRQAAAVPKLEQFSLDDLVSTIVNGAQVPQGLVIQRAGPQPFIVEGDQSLIGLCLSNGLRNAIEATIALDDFATAPITISWQSTDVEYWVAVIDNGIGFSGNLKKAFEIGTTTKADHFGMGLAIVSQSVSSMNGKVYLVPNERGVRFEIRWPKRSS